MPIKIEIYAKTKARALELLKNRSNELPWGVLQYANNAVECLPEDSPDSIVWIRIGGMEPHKNMPMSHMDCNVTRILVQV